MKIVRRRDHFHAECPACRKLVGAVHRSINAGDRVAALQRALESHRCSGVPAD